MNQFTGHNSFKANNYFYVRLSSFDMLITIISICWAVNQRKFQVMYSLHMYGTPEGTFLFQCLPEKKSKQKELERKSK